MEELINVDILEDLLVASTKTIVCGAINTGKSTMCQTLVNRSIKQQSARLPIMLLDLDIGQPYIWGIPGFITLYQFNDSQNPTIVFQGFVGEFSTQHNLELYLKQIELAMRFVKSNQLIVNTQGFIQSFGRVLIQHMLNIICPDLVIVMQNSPATQAKAEQLSDRLHSGGQFYLNNENQPNVVGWKTIMFNNQGTTHKPTPQTRKLRRQSQLCKGLGVRESHLQLDLHTSACQTITLAQSTFVHLGFGLDFQSHSSEQTITAPIEIADLFIGSLVAISFDKDINSFGIGFIKDLDIKNGKALVISQTRLDHAFRYRFLKSLHYHFDKEHLIPDINQLIETKELADLADGLSLEKRLNIPYVFPASRAVGFKSLKLKINKKKQKATI